jgi:hypothetical protein
MKGRLLFIASIAALVVLSVPLFAQARGTSAARVSHKLVSRTTTTWIAPGLTRKQAVGLAPIPAATLRRLGGHVVVCSGHGHVLHPHCGGGGYWAGCSTKSWLQTFGNWPWNVSMTDTTHWCASDGILTSRDSSVTQTGSTACTTNGTSKQVVSGGVGHLNVDWKDIGQWNCDIGITTQGATDWVEMHVDANGPADYSVVATHSDCLGGC